MNQQVFQTLKKGEPAPHNHPYADFDYSPEKEFEKDSQKEEQQARSVNVSCAIICDRAPAVCSMLLGEEGQPREHRDIDLVVRRGRNSRGEEMVFKYWVVEAGIRESPMAQSTSISIQSISARAPSSSGVPSCRAGCPPQCSSQPASSCRDSLPTSTNFALNDLFYFNDIQLLL